MRIRVLPLLTLFVVTSLAHGKSSLLSFDQIRSELQPFGLSSVQFSSTDYQIPNFRWIYREFMPFYKSYLKGSRARYQDEGVDCDNFCIFFQSALFQRKVQLGYEHAGNTAAGMACGSTTPQRGPYRHDRVLPNSFLCSWLPQILHSKSCCDKVFGIRQT